MNNYNDHIEEAIDYFNHELECRKHQVSVSNFLTTLQLAKEKNAYETAVECLKEQLSQPPVKAIRKSVVHENRGDKPHTWRGIELEVWECPRCRNTVWSGIRIAKKSPYCSDCGQKIDWEDIENGKIN